MDPIVRRKLRELEALTGGGAAVGSAMPQPIGTATAGVDADASREDHVHAHGDQLGGTLHADASGAAAGFMSAAKFTEIGTATTDIAALDTRLDAAESDIAALESADTSLDTRLDALEAIDHVAATVTTTNGLSIAGQEVSLAAAGAAQNGAVTTGTQTFTGKKTFSDPPVFERFKLFDDASTYAGMYYDSPDVVFNAYSAFYLNMDSNNNDGTEVNFTIAKDRTGKSGGTVLFTVNTAGTAQLNGVAVLSQTNTVTGITNKSLVAPAITGATTIGTGATITTPTITLPAWTALSYSNSWVTFGGSYDTAGHRKMADGNVQLRGAIKDGTATDGTLMFTLPAGSRPTGKSLHRPSGGTTGIIEINTDGTVKCYAFSSNTEVVLSGIVFPTT